MRVLFVSGNREKLPDAVIPLGMLYVIASTPAHHEREWIDLCFESYPEQALRDAVRAAQPGLVALGMRNIQNNDYSGIGDNLSYYAGLIGSVREVSSAPIVLGGAGFSVMPSELMRRLGPDFGIAGEGERALPALLDALENETELAAVPGLHWRAGDEIRANPPAARFLDLDAVAEPDRGLVDPRYYARYATDAVQTKRGCPLRCDYCTYPIIEGRVGRTRGPERVVDEMFRAVERQPDIRHVFIVDSVFNLPRAHAKGVCRELIRRRWSIPWTCYANPLGFDAEMAELARAAGCAGMEIGSDSGCDEVLTRMRKGFKTEDIRRIHGLCADAGIRDCHTFILGTHGETIDDVARTLDFASELDPFGAIFMIWVDDHESVEPELRTARAALRGEIAELLRARAARHPHWASPSLGINFSRKLFRQMRRAGLHGPLWQHVRGASPAAATL